MNSLVVNGRHFREKLAEEIIIKFPFIAQDYKMGLTSSQIRIKYDLDK